MDPTPHHPHVDNDPMPDPQLDPSKKIDSEDTSLKPGKEDQLTALDAAKQSVEPLLKFKRWSSGLAEMLGKDVVSCLAASDRFIVFFPDQGHWHPRRRRASDGH